MTFAAASAGRVTGVADYLSAAWFTAVREHISSLTLNPQVAAPGFDLAVTITASDREPVTYRLTFLDDQVAFDRPPSAERPEVGIDVDAATAARIAAAELSAQRAFMAGDLRVTGDVTLLIHHAAILDSIGPMFGSQPGAPDGN